MKLLFATFNPGKVAEVRWLLEQAGWQVLSLAEVCPDLKLQETGATFEENARQKARAAAQATHMWTLAEDSGLEVGALGGEPGVISARFGGREASDQERSRAILARMIAVPDEHRRARFRCVMCLIDPAGTEAVFEGVCEGRIAHHLRGASGFGYDPIFIPDGYAQTFAELGMEVKSRISHRAKALQQLIRHLQGRVREPITDRPGT